MGGKGMAITGHKLFHSAQAIFDIATHSAPLNWQLLPNEDSL